jgi:hypothetical protein
LKRRAVAGMLARAIGDGKVEVMDQRVEIGS